MRPVTPDETRALLQFATLLLGLITLGYVRGIPT